MTRKLKFTKNSNADISLNDTKQETIVIHFILEM